MKTTACLVILMSLAAGATSAVAQVRSEFGPEPSQSFTVCSHLAEFEVNDRAIPVRTGTRRTAIPTSNGAWGDDGIATVTRTPDVFIQTRRQTQHSYQTLAPVGTACSYP